MNTGNKGGIVLGVHGPSNERLHCYTPSTSSWSPCAKTHDVSDATKLVARGITTALTGVTPPYTPPRAYNSKTRGHRNQGQREGATERFWEGGLHPFGPQGVFPSTTPQSEGQGEGGTQQSAEKRFSKGRLDQAALLMAWAGKRSVLLARVHSVVHHAASRLHYSRGQVQRILMTMHLLSSGGIPSSSSSSGTGQREGAGEGEGEGEGEGQRVKQFLEHVDVLALEEDREEGGRDTFLSYFEAENERRLKLRAGLEGDGSSSSTHVQQVVATGKALQYLARHVASHAAQIHFLQEKLDYTVETLSASRSGDNEGDSGVAFNPGEGVGVGGGDDLLESLIQTVDLLHSSFSEGEASLVMMEQAVQTALRACDVHWDVVDDAAVYSHIKGREVEDKLWFERPRGVGSTGNTRSGVNINPRDGGLRGVLMYLLGKSSSPRAGSGGGVHPSSRKGVEAALKAVGQARSADMRAPGAQGWVTSTLPLLAAVVALALGAAALWGLLTGIQRKAKKMA